MPTAALASALLLVLAGAMPSHTGSSMPAESALPPGNSFVVREVRLFDGRQVTERTTVVVQHGLITAVGDSPTIPANLPSVDGRGATLLPGLIDAHVHVFPGAQHDALRFGVTTELDMFTLAPDFPAWRAQRSSLARTDSADTWSAGIGVSAPGGHPSGTMPGSSGIPVLARASDASAFVAARAAEGSDYIKIISEDNSFLNPKHPIPALTRDEICAAVDAAHRLGKLAIVHASRLREAREAITCGTDGLAHTFGDQVADAEFVRLAVSHHVFVESTLGVLAAGSGMALVHDIYASPAIAALLSPAQKKIVSMSFGDLRPRGIDAALASVRLLHAAGVPLLAGTDAPNPAAPHGAGLHVELQLLVRAGLTPAEALAAATSVPADVFHLGGRGCVAVGCRADLLLVEGDPTTDISRTLAIRTVWKNGYTVRREVGSDRPQAAS